MHHVSKDGAPQPVSRLGLYAPTGLLMAGALAWSGFWFYTAQRAEAQLADWVGTEAANGRNWKCTDQVIGGFPFRIELKCSSVSLSGAEDKTAMQIQTGPLHAATQIYSPKLILADLTGPVTIRAGALDLSANWEALLISARVGNSIERVSLSASEPQITLALENVGRVPSHAKRLELHARTDGERLAANDALDIAARVIGARIPAADVLTGSSENLDLDLSGSAMKITALPIKDWRSTLDRWRINEGSFMLDHGRITKGALRLDGSGVLRLDASRRLEGRLEVAANGLGPLISRFAGGGMNQLATPLFEKSDGTSVKWPVRLQDGRVQMGPLRSGPILAPLY